jgi:hypothetical protein
MSSQGNPKNLTAYDGEGDEFAPTSAGMVSLAIDTAYFPIPCEGASEVAIHILTDATIATTFTVEGCNFPKRVGETGPLDVEDWSEAAGEWVQINVAGAGYAQGSGTGWTITILSLVKTAGAGGAIVNLIGVGFRRLRLKAVTTIAGTVRVVSHGKS